VSLAKRALSGFLWTTGANISSRVVTIVSTFILTRFLAPELQGEVNVAVAIVALLSSASAFGVGQFIAAHPKESRAVVFHGGLLVIGGGIVTSLIAVLLRHPLTGLLNTPGAASFIPLVALAGFIDRLSWLPRNVLVREMQFKLVGLRIALGEFVYAGTSIALAYKGFGAYAIVYANLARAILALLFLASVTQFRDYFEPARLKLEIFGRILRFGMPINQAGLLGVAATLGDNMLMARLFGPATVGLYNQAYRVAELPGTTLGDQVTDVLVPTFARIDDVQERKRGFLRAVGLMAVLVFPMSAGLGAVAHTMVATFYAPSYAGVAPFLAVLATMSMLRSFGWLAMGYLQVVGRTLQLMYIELVLVISILGFIAVFSPFGPVVSACGVGLGFSLHTVLLLSRLKPEDVHLSDVGKTVIGPFLACGPMVGAVFAARYLWTWLGLPAGVGLLCEVTFGAIMFVAGAFIFARTLANEFIKQAKGVIARKRGRAEPEAPEAS
jgi:lipopolysaccharide exporter